ncbi:helix-turn-helix domain-containing protein [Autumnicola musiva]|uniref:Helix-turn-helix domain-containing protein n=1 Tax=Autumnicola musiva TaxID=3075589 RepID=A0ABU3D7P3_9FLAO|nr:helix-turn-helix domain-containing protein [Zunongwangia sp. F117]MDT0677390.1 helix-turn-helix domain-containing protein [Zunongwangia sp. F117]
MERSKLHKRVKDLKVRQNLSQEELAVKAGLSLRTIQRIENGESVPRGDSLRKLSIALQVTPDDLIDWQIQEDKNVVKMLNLSQLGFLAFPILGIVIPLAIWILKKDKTKYVDSVGKSILNFQITWTISLFSFYLLFMLNAILHIGIISMSMFFIILAGLYLYNLYLIIRNTLFINRIVRIQYKPAIKFLN